MGGPVIQVTELSKTYRVQVREEGLWHAVKALFRPEFRMVHALSGVSFEVDGGESVGYIGPNGAGKSTTIKILTGILTATSGKARVLGKDPFRHRMEAVRHFGIVFGQRSQLWWNIPVIETFRLLRHVYQVPKDEFERNLRFFVDLLELGPVLKTPVRQLSLGQKMRAELCGALLHGPKVLFLDEPTIGLDVVAKQNMRAFLRTVVQERGVTLLLTTHDLGDIEELCPRVILLDGGRILYDGDLEELKERHGAFDVMTVVTDAELADDALAGWKRVRAKRLDARRYQIEYPRAEATPMEVLQHIGQYATVIDFSLRSTPIEETIASIYRRRGIEREGAVREGAVKEA